MRSCKAEIFYFVYIFFKNQADCVRINTSISLKSIKNFFYVQFHSFLPLRGKIECGAPKRGRDDMLGGGRFESSFPERTKKPLGGRKNRINQGKSKKPFSLFFYFDQNL